MSYASVNVALGRQPRRAARRRVVSYIEAGNDAWL